METGNGFSGSRFGQNMRDGWSVYQGLLRASSRCGFRRLGLAFVRLRLDLVICILDCTTSASLFRRLVSLLSLHPTALDVVWDKSFANMVPTAYYELKYSEVLPSIT